jgi:phosphopantothenoylcysteine synthetase/decarboxylase
MRVLVTCGPSYEPIDQVRRLTNFSTGELGIMLANRLTQAGFEVLCFKGVGATCPLRAEGARVLPFTTNGSLRAELEGVENRSEIHAVFHAAALCDYRVKSVHSSSGAEIAAAKIPSRAGELTLTLEPLPKLLPELRQFFPASRIVGWKYELVGTRDDVLAAAARQMRETGTDLCVVNGAAFGAGFGVCQRGGRLLPCTDKARLCEHLVQWAQRMGSPNDFTDPG